MDLKRCPSCGQSVLDDDAEVCPFCNASMSGKGAPPPKPTRPQPKAAPPQSAKAPTPSPTAAGKAEEQPAEDEDPFAVRAPQSVRAVRCLPKPKKGWTARVVCPMCDTAGFVPAQAAGKQVRCANPDCMMPIFEAHPTVPEKKSEVEKEPPAKKGISAGAIMATVIGIAAVGVGAWWLSQSGSHFQPVNVGIPDDYVPEEDRVVPKEVKPVEHSPLDDLTNPNPLKPDQKQAVDKQQMLKLIPEKMIELARQQNNNRSKPYCRQQTAEAFAHLGQLNLAREELKQLSVVGKNNDFYAITPLVQMAWQELAADRQSQAEELIEQAWELSEQLPKFGRASLDSATQLATALAAVGKNEQAGQLVQKFQRTDELGQLSGLLLSESAHGRWDIHRALKNRPLVPWSAPLWVTVTSSLAAHGSWDAAQKWAEQAPAGLPRLETLIALGEAAATDGKQAGSDKSGSRLQGVLKKLPPFGQALLLARIARLQAAAGEKQAAEKSLADARKYLDEFTAPSSVELPEMRGIYDMLSLPDPADLRKAAVAATAVAFVEAQLSQREQAWKSLMRAMAYCRGSAPSLADAQERLRKLDQQGSQSMQRQFKKLLELDTDNQARVAVRRYQKKLQQLEEAAQERFQLQCKLLAVGVQAGLLDEVWQEVSARAESPDLGTREPYFESDLPQQLHGAFAAAGEKEKAETIAAQMPRRAASADPLAKARTELAQLIESGDVEQAAKLIEAVGAETGLRTEWALKWSSYLIDQGKLDLAWKLVAALPDLLVREDVYFWVAAQAGSMGQEQEVWRFLGAKEYSATEGVSIYLGLLRGLLTKQ